MDTEGETRLFFFSTTTALVISSRHSCRCHLGEHEHAVIVVLSFFLLTAILSDGALGEHEHDNRHFLDTS